ncbi:hamartin-like [Uloborus diversus]|uniref:hamartin-like n=1 Tax=Uloborus diversus TaxID=327109 RepID=UPI00240A09D9|nr:hamartin-like [Uloborus diversus]
MYQRKEKVERHSSQEGVLELVSLLESSNPDIVDSVKNLICENLSTSKDSRLLYGLVDYFIAVQSNRSLDILLRVKDPHDKHLFDRMNELLKSEPSRYQTLQLLCGLVYKQPSWLHKISQHKVMNTVFNILKNDVEPPNLIAALFAVICLLPMIPSQMGGYLGDTFDVFSRLVAWNYKKPSTVPETCVLHLQIGVYSLFHRLYGMFPCNFLAYLRSYYGGRDYNADNYRVFSSFIKPMLERVRLHPLLVTASKETELSANRWKKMAYHDIIVDCASISLDAVEGTRETLKSQDLLQGSPHFARDSLQFISLSSQSSVVSTNEASLGTSGVMWSPSHACGFSTPPPFAPPKGERELKTRSSIEEDHAVDHAVEAKPEVFRSEPDKQSSLTEKPAPETTPKSGKSAEGEDSKENVPVASIFQAVEAKEEDTDKEVSELTGGREPSRGEGRHDTPFCSTTLNLTDEPPPAEGEAAPQPKGSEEEGEEMFSSLQEGDGEAFVPTFNRFRYFSHCGPPPDIPQEPVGKRKLARSRSCPEMSAPDPGPTAAARAEASPHHPAAADADASVAPPDAERAGYEQLIPLAVAPQPLPGSAGAPPAPLFSSLSPPELLDDYVRMGSGAYLARPSPIPIPAMKTTDWTHFDGPPPADEVTILRNEVLLLYSQLLFERHRKDVHSERNRRILGRAKRARMHDELVDALKQQISLLEKDNQDMKSENDSLTSLIHRVQSEKQQVVAELKSHVAKLGKENSLLSSANEKLKSLLSAKKEENDQLRLLCQHCQSESLDLRAELEMARRETERCESFKRDAIYTSKQLILLQELNSHYRDKLELMRERPSPDIGRVLLEEAERAELKDLKQKLDSKTCLLDATKGRIADLESSLAAMKAKQKEQSQVVERIKRVHQDEVEIREERLRDLRKITVQKDVYILELHKDIETLQQKLIKMERTRDSLPSTSQDAGRKTGAEESCVQ